VHFVGVTTSGIPCLHSIWTIRRCCPANDCDTAILRSAGESVDVDADKPVLRPMSVYTPDQSGQVLRFPVAAVANEASEIAFPARNAPAVKAPASQADQSNYGQDHRLPSGIGHADRVRAGLRYRRG